MIPNAEMMTKVSEWRRKVADGTITLDEMRAAIVFMRGGRSAALEASAASKSAGGKKPKSKPPVNADALLGELGI